MTKSESRARNSQLHEGQDMWSGEARPGTNANLAGLIRMHRDLDQRLSVFAERLALTPEEQIQVAIMKKRKLALKDRIAALSASS